ncbi:hypothetical protein J3E68DRAFT_127590 [Trichoderma sp. SZMC 28012]
MNIESAPTFDCFIICNTKHEREKLSKKLTWFEGYEIRNQKEEWIEMALIRSDNTQTSPPEYMSLDKFLVKSGFVEIFSNGAARRYVKSSGWNASRWNTLTVTTTVVVLILMFMMMFNHEMAGIL